jgi:arylformamidase
MIIYKQYDQQALDQQYNNRFNSLDHESHLQQWELVNRETEKKYKLYKSIAYGELERETLDIFPSDQPNAKTLVFIHGGYWYKNGPFDVYLIAEAFRGYGITTVLIGYPLMPDHPLDQLVASCRKAIGWVYQNISGYHGNPEQVYVAGHSAGGHLAAMMMATNWPQFDSTLPSNIIKGVCAISGLYNLLPVQLCYVNEILKMDDATVIRNSPVHLSPETPCPLILAVGGEETAEYKAQTDELFTTWKEKGADVQVMDITGTNHFSVLTSLLTASSQLPVAIGRLMHIVK